MITKYGSDVTDAFIKGAYETLNIALETGATTVILKERSPSCGGTMIYSGEFNGNKRWTWGQFLLLKRNGIKVFSEENVHEYLDEMETHG